MWYSNNAKAKYIKCYNVINKYNYRSTSTTIVTANTTSNFYSAISNSSLIIAYSTCISQPLILLYSYQLFLYLAHRGKNHHTLTDYRITHFGFGILKSIN